MFIFYRLQHKDVFALIKKYDLYNDIHRMIIPLFQLDKVKTISMLKEKNKISTDIVVQQLEPRQDFLFAVNFWRRLIYPIELIYRSLTMPLIFTVFRCIRCRTIQPLPFEIDQPLCKIRFQKIVSLPQTLQPLSHARSVRHLQARIFLRRNGLFAGTNGQHIGSAVHYHP